MKDNPTWKDAIPSEVKSDLGGFRDSSGFALSDAEAESALMRLQDAVQNETVPQIWMGSHMSEFEHRYQDDVKANIPAHQSLGLSELKFGSEIKSMSSQGRQSRSLKSQKRWGRFTVGLAAAAIIVGVFTTPMGTKAIADAMRTFYFQNLVGVGQDDLMQIENALAGGSPGRSTVDLKQYGTVEVVHGDTPTQQNLSLNDVEQLAGFQVKTLPGFDSKRDPVSYGPSRTLTFHLNVTAINGLIERLSGKTDFPASMDGEAIVVHIPAQIGEQVSGPGGGYMSLGELQMPTIQVPSHVDINQVRQALIDLPFMPSDIRQSLSESQNWQSTLYVPVGGKVTNVTLNGNPAVLQSGGQGEDPRIMWLQNGILYELSGSPSTFPTADSVVAEAKELAK